MKYLKFNVGHIYDDLDDKFKNDKEIAFTAFKINPDINYECLPKKFKDDPKFLIRVVVLNIEKLKKQIIFRCSYTGTKETDLLYQKTIIKNIDLLTFEELQNLLTLFTELSDPEFFLILTKKKNPHKVYKILFNKLLK